MSELNKFQEKESISPTFHLANRDYYEILDLYISSPNLLDKIDDFKVLYDWDMTSDHYPVQLKLNSNYISINQASLEKFSYDFKRADWVKFKSLLCNSQYEDCSDLEFNNIEAIAKTLLIQLDKEGKQKD
ncbi:hypothetical protein BpHYR1_008483 [Brachionus plicatilis]|uniref:RNA-directed DNA polymerase from mobile element jockey-like n=1 Tax=Brachionus plicatilis TaxID=10195 RepID=A0A3M7S8E9_BRAPC|nr:hypothetical protein BpHYR1_008483 [Brachionus plicatilis]